jgi:hypothetical protein
MSRLSLDDIDELAELLDDITEAARGIAAIVSRDDEGDAKLRRPGAITRWRLRR